MNRSNACRLWLVLVIFLFPVAVPCRTIAGAQWKALGPQVESNSDGPAGVSFTQCDLVIRNTSIWNTTWAGSDWDVGEAIAACSDGGYAIAGYTYSAGAGDSDILVVKLDRNGNIVWNRTYGGPGAERAFDIVECADGGLALAGITTSYGAGGWDFWLLRTDAAGNPLWNQTYGGPNYDEARSLVVTDTGGFAMAGTLSGEDGDWDIWLVVTMETGAELWNRTYGGSLDDTGTALVTCRGGGFAIAGTTESFGAGEYDFCLYRVDDEGGLIWNSTYGTAGYEEAWSLVELDVGGFVIAGDGSPDSAASAPAWLVRTDEGGAMVWNMTCDYGSRCSAVIESSPGGVVFLTDRGGAALVRLSLDGNLTWAYESGLDMVATDIVPTHDGGFAITGWIATELSGPKECDYDASAAIVPDLPYWRTIPLEYYIEYGNGFELELDLVAAHGVNTWALEGTSDFDIDSNGIIRNVTTLHVGDYDIGVRVRDTLNNELSQLFVVRVRDTTPPHWTEMPTDQVVQQGEHFRYDLNASDLSGIGSWHVNDTVHFSIDAEGVLENRVPLRDPSYPLLVIVNDTYGNALYGTFTVLVEGGFSPSYVQGIVIAAAVSIVLVVGVWIAVRHQRS
ncbi:MAG: hypothetical protein ACTSV8_08385 [Candidatus Thorarchaeota archaeon]